MIWRRLLLRSDHSIADLHYTIQIALGWSDSHLHRFHIHGKDYGVAHEGGLTFSDDPERVRLVEFGFRPRERFLYEYDFYDNWKHDIWLEKVLPLNSKRVFPVCIGGRRPVPPEDSGGARAYREEGDPRWRQLHGPEGCQSIGAIWRRLDGCSSAARNKRSRRFLSHFRSQKDLENL